MNYNKSHVGFVTDIVQQVVCTSTVNKVYPDVEHVMRSCNISLLSNTVTVSHSPALAAIDIGIWSLWFVNIVLKPDILRTRTGKR